ncbi:MAG: hypothetical protein QOG48_2428 [Verrucomicrobiota bacterium]|jgi:hypothetical protein
MLRNIPSSALKQLVRLSERREGLMSQIQQIDREIVRLESRFGVPAADDRSAAVTISSKPRERKTSGRRTKRGALREAIVNALRAAGKRGSTVRQLSQKLRVPPANLYVWFNASGKKVRGLKKIGPATYRLSI